MLLHGRSIESGKKIKHYYYNYWDEVGRGNFSKVYKALNTKTQQTVAIKVVSLDDLKSQRLEQLVYEQIKILQEMDHPSILKFYQALISERNCYIVTQFCEGGNLQDLFKKKKGFNEAELGSIVADVYQGLRYLRDMRVCHRDIKSANIFMSGGKAKIADFGLAKFYKQSFKDLDIGSPLYMSPEGLNKQVYGEKTDTWAFGVFIYELIHGKSPYTDCKSEYDLKAAVSRPLPDHKFKQTIQPQLKQLINWLLTIDENKRPSMYELQNDHYLKEVLGGQIKRGGVGLVQTSSRMPRNGELNAYGICKPEVYAQSNAVRVIELGGGYKNSSNSSHSNTSTFTKQRPSSHYSHLQQNMTPPHKPSNGQLYTMPYSADRPTKTYSSKTADTRQSDDELFLKRGPDYRVYPSMMK